MPTLGEELKEHREAKGLSLTDISEATKIGTRFLKAIEADNFSILPGGIFTRSFIRTYAKQVGMSEDKAIGLYQQQMAAIEEPAPLLIEAEAAPIPKLQPKDSVEEELPRRPVVYLQSSSQTSWSTIIIGLVIALLVFLIIFTVVRRMHQSVSEPPPVAEIAPSSAEAPTTASPSPPPSTSTTPAQPTPQPPPPVTASEGLHVKLEATNGESWLKYVVDDAQPGTQMILTAGQPLELPSAQNQIYIKFGNRSAIKVTINNREVTFPTDTPKHKYEMTVTRDNLQSFFTPTPTSSPSQ